MESIIKINKKNNTNSCISKHYYKKYNTKMPEEAAIAPWFHLRLPSCYNDNNSSSSCCSNNNGNSSKSKKQQQNQ